MPYFLSEIKIEVINKLNIFDFTSVWNVKEMNKHRRQAVLARCHGNSFKAGNLLMGHSKRSHDPEVKSKARSDALYFFAMTKNNQR